MSLESSPIYSLRVADVYLALETSPQGLSDEEAGLRHSLYGKNSLIEPPRSSFWLRSISHLVHPMALTLWGAGALALLVRQPGWAVLIWLLVVLNGGFSYWREFRAEKAIAALSRLLPVYARVVRNGEEKAVEASELVPGDVLVLAEGDNIPADARVVEEYGLRTNNSTLTGEAVPARKSADASLLEGMSELERTNLVFTGTSVVSGTGRAVVYATGMLTQFGRIARLTQQVQEPPSPIQTEMLQLTRWISTVALVTALVVFGIGMFDVNVAMDFQSAFLLALGIFVAVVPEGLPGTITLVLAMAGQRLAQQSVLVKKLSSIETLGTVSVICTDKSGTLTQNQMVVREIWTNRRKIRVSGIGYEPVGEFTSLVKDQTLSRDELQALLTAAALCNNSRLNPPTNERPHWSSLGDQTEVAMRVAALKAGVDGSVLNEVLPRIHEIPFDARRKRMSTIHRNKAGQIAFVKGAPREVLSLCTHVWLEGEVKPLDNALRAEILAANDAYASRALRVLALAQRELPARASGAYNAERIEMNLTFLGLMAMMDPPRPEVAQAVQTCRQAGIQMVMVTGDYGLTAESMARRIGMLETADPLIITGVEIDEMSDEMLEKVLGGDKEIVFARMAPEHKLRLVAAFQSRGEVVAVTGDGVNDAPALRKADIGIVMGIVGTDVAKEAADVIITNDSFMAIVHAIEEGRAIFDNLRKFITYIFASNVPEVLPFMLRAMFPVPMALTFKQILAIDLGTDLVPALALGVEKPEPDIMRRPPRRREQKIVDRTLLTRSFLWLGMIEAALCYFGFYLVYEISGDLNFTNLPIIQWLDRNPQLNVPSTQVDSLAVTVFLVGVVMAQIGNVFACRTERLRGRHLGWLSNQLVLGGVILETILILLLVYFPPLQRAFGHVAIPPSYWLVLAGYGPLLYFLDWIRKILIRRREVWK